MARRSRHGRKSATGAYRERSLYRSDYALIQVVPHTTRPRGSQFEVQFSTRFLETGAFNVQGMLAVPSVKCLKHLGTLSAGQISEIEPGSNNGSG